MKNKLLALWEKVKNLFKQGLTPKQLALSLVISLLISVFPIFGITSIVLTCLALLLRLNLPIMIASAQLFGPLKFLVLIPFIHIGASLFGTEHTLLTYNAIKSSFDEGFFATAKSLSFELLCGATGWLITAIPAGFVLYLILKSILTYIEKFRARQSAKA